MNWKGTPLATKGAAPPWNPCQGNDGPGPTSAKMEILFWAGIGTVALFLGTANPFVHIPLLFALYPGMLFLLGRRSPRPFRHGWLCGLMGASFSLYWISVAVHDYGYLPWLPSLVAALLLGGYVGLWGGIFAKAVSWMNTLSSWRCCVGAALLWYLLEWCRSWLFTGFPWLTAASGQAAWPVLIQGASILGEYGLSGLIAAMGICEVLAFGENKAQGIAPRWHFALATLALFGLIFGFGSWRLKNADERMAETNLPPVRLGLVQGNIRQDLKWDDAFQQATVDKYLSLSREALQQKGAAPIEALIWPETAMPFYYQSSPDLALLLNTFAVEQKTALIFGAPGFYRPPPTAGETGQALVYNRAFFLDKNGALVGSYDKQHLVPFGEYVPPGFDLPFFSAITAQIGGFTPGNNQRPFFLPRSDRQETVSLGMLICYEAIFPEIARQQVAFGAEILINISNDAWYQRSSAPVQHLYLALMRSVEQDRWLARSTNTGLTAFVDPRGHILSLGGLTDGSGLFNDAYLVTDLSPRRTKTVFFHIQPWLPALALSTILFILWPAIYSFAASRRERPVEELTRKG